MIKRRNRSDFLRKGKEGYADQLGGNVHLRKAVLSGSIWRFNSAMVKGGGGDITELIVIRICLYARY